ncbi:DUF4886 domain-containing protein [Enterococcus sp. DIV0086]|uniref:DUF4886 domain-containing protein n=1 Tax=Enterococcus sp. DIV0086 TaxID=2774655 RepID=UPI003D29BAF9
MIKILAIGNSFSENATHYVHQIAEASGVDTKVVNLYIGGCSLAQHWENIQNNRRDYRFEQNGFYEDNAPLVAINETIINDDWNHIVIQQSSDLSGIESSYEPYVGNILRYLTEKAPQAQIWLHQTWAYEIDSLHPAFTNYGNNQKLMYQKLTTCYQNIAEKYLLPLITSGSAIQTLRLTAPFNYDAGGLSLCAEDGYHLTIIYGRYAASLVWAKTLLDIDPKAVAYLPESRFAPNFLVSPQYLNVIKNTVS